MLKKILKTLFFIALACCLALTLAILLHYFEEQNTSKKSDSAILFTAQLPDTSGKIQHLAQYQHKIIVVNFWATWCPPCREEMPELIALQQAYKEKNVTVLGIALDEPAQVAEYLKSTPVNYPILVDDMAGSLLSEQLGNDKGVLPYTVIIDAEGNIARTHFGRITKAMIEASLQSLVTASTQ